MSQFSAEDRRATSRKGWFAQGRLPVAATYVPLHRRRRLLWLGGGLAIAFLAVAAFDVGRDGPQLLSGGPLSSAHASFSGDCSSCHEPLAGAASQRCVDCHDPLATGPGGPEPASLTSPAAAGVFDVQSHAVRFGSVPRALTSSPTCAGCHEEHLGRDHSPAEVQDTTCRSCHEMGSFESTHPQFDAVAAQTPAAGTATLAFTHVFHVAELLKGDSPLAQRVGQAAISEASATCSFCHETTPDGAGYQPIAFDQHCSSCHLNSTQNTEWLTLAGGAANEPAAEGSAADAEFGVRLLDGSEGGKRWANPSDLRERRGRVRKTGIRHADPWILENLRRLRQQVFEPAPLADLLAAAPEHAEQEPELLYRGAIDELEQRIDQLQESGDRSTQSELRSLRELLRTARQRLQASQRELNADAFAVGLRALPLSSERQSDLDELQAGLLGNCTSCHRVDRLTLVQAKADLAMLQRARFDHAAHRLQAACLDCHDRIPELAALTRGEQVDPELAAAGSDRAETVNLPGVERCTSCHRAEQAAATCTTCHGYHPVHSGDVNVGSTRRLAATASASGGSVQ